MKAVVYKGPRDVVVKNVPDAKIEKATDVLVKITTTNICGSDLHMYEGRTNMEPGRIFGHENLGTVVELSLIHISEPTRLGMISYAVFCLKKKKKKKNH